MKVKSVNMLVDTYSGLNPSNVAPVIDGFNDYLQSPVIEYIHELPLWKVISVRSYDRIEVISNTHYGTTDYWWLILVYNKIRVPSELPDTINLFDMSTLLYLIGKDIDYKVVY